MIKVNKNFSIEIDKKAKRVFLCSSEGVRISYNEYKSPKYSDKLFSKIKAIAIEANGDSVNQLKNS